MPDRKKDLPLTAAAAEREMRRLTRRSFTTGAVAAVAGLGAFGWLTTASQEDGLPWPLRRVLRFNQWLAEGYSSPQRLAPTFPETSVRGPARTNGLIGLSAPAKVADWQLCVQHQGRAEQVIHLRAVQELSRTD